MLVNLPALEESKWPRAVMDTTPGEDLELQLRIFESLAKMKVPIAHVTASETFKVPLAQPGEAVLESSAPQPLQPFGQPPAEDDEREPDPFAARERMMSEPQVITVTGRNGEQFDFMSHWPVYTENRGIVKASMLTNDDVLVEDPSRDRRRLRIAR
jgi:hypothetical protein